MPTGYAPSDVPVQTTKLQSAATVRRAKTLTRPERSVAPPPLINPQSTLFSSPSGTVADNSSSSLDAWVIFSKVVTWWAPAFLLQSIGGLKDKNTIQAWREKMALCFIVAILCAIVGFSTVGLQKVLCPETSSLNTKRFISLGSTSGTLGVGGFAFNVTQSLSTDSVDFLKLSQSLPGQDITPHFQRDADSYPACKGLSYRIALDSPCTSATKCDLGALNSSAVFSSLKLVNMTRPVGYDWDQIDSLANYIVLDGSVLNLNPYLQLHPTAIPSDNVDLAIRTLLADATGGRDGTRLFVSRSDIKKAMPCLVQRYSAGNIDKITPGCFVSQLVLYAGLIVILTLVLVRFAMACIFNWFLSERLAGSPDSMTLNRSAISPSVMPEGANVSIDNKHGTAPWAGPGGTKKLAKPGKGAKSGYASSTTLASQADSAAPIVSLAQIGAELFAVCLVTCYSEGEESLRTTLDSISTTTYSDARKLLFIVADGMITGAGEKRSTPDLCVSMLEADPRFGNPMPMSYIAVGSGSKQDNRAMVYAGHYSASIAPLRFVRQLTPRVLAVAGRRTPTVIVVKCGTEQEAATEKKPGNRGKRDSQLILMNFFSRVTYNDRMTPLDFDLFRKMHILMGVTPDFFEVCLMVSVRGVCLRRADADRPRRWMLTPRSFPTPSPTSSTACTTTR